MKLLALIGQGSTRTWIRQLPAFSSQARCASILAHVHCGQSASLSSVYPFKTTMGEPEIIDRLQYILHPPFSPTKHADTFQHKNGELHNHRQAHGDANGCRTIELDISAADLRRILNTAVNRSTKPELNCENHHQKSPLRSGGALAPQPPPAAAPSCRLASTLCTGADEAPHVESRPLPETLVAAAPATVTAAVFLLVLGCGGAQQLGGWRMSSADISNVLFCVHVEEFLAFFSTTVAERTLVGQRLAVEENENRAYAYRYSNSLCAVVIADRDYPERVALGLATKIVDEYSKEHDDRYINSAEEKTEFAPLRQYITKYQDPRQADEIMRVQEELDKTKVVLHKTIESILERGEKLENLVDRSNMLSSQSKMFYTTAKKTNSCCIVM
ncbi:palmitoyltransferase [Coemansia thaxteri]|nr:palmitoyltransferase [Coemansia thaxteri]